MNPSFCTSKMSIRTGMGCDWDGTRRIETDTVDAVLGPGEGASGMILSAFSIRGTGGSDGRAVDLDAARYVFPFPNSSTVSTRSKVPVPRIVFSNLERNQRRECKRYSIVSGTRRSRFRVVVFVSGTVENTFVIPAVFTLVSDGRFGLRQCNLFCRSPPRHTRPDSCCCAWLFRSQAVLQTQIGWDGGKSRLRLPLGIPSKKECKQKNSTRDYMHTL